MVKPFSSNEAEVHLVQRELAFIQGVDKLVSKPLTEDQIVLLKGISNILEEKKHEYEMKNESLHQQASEGKVTKPSPKNEGPDESTPRLG